jgi:hypothetical protein
MQIKLPSRFELENTLTDVTFEKPDALEMKLRAA